MQNVNIKIGNIAQYIEHTNVSPTATKKDIERLCQEVKKYKFYGICVSSFRAASVKKMLGKSNIKIVCVIGFPHGSSNIKSKVTEVKEAIKYGADEVDMTMNISALKDKEYDYVLKDIGAVVDASRSRVVKVIIEVGYLTKYEVKKAAQIIRQAGAHFVKTGTGYGPRGVKVSDVILLHSILKGSIGIKASGGIHTYQKALSMIRAGADRIGTSHGVEIIKQQTLNF